MGNVGSKLKEKLKHKIKAVSIHLLLSLIILAVFWYVIRYLWYPEPFFTAQGGWQGIRLMAFVDLVLGPTLTLIVYNHLKQRKEIIFDFSLIAIVQIGALVLGGYTVFSQRPIALVYWTGTFYTVTGEDYQAQGIKSPDFSQYSDHIPPLIYSRPTTTNAELQITREMTKQSIPAYVHVELYEKIEDNLEAIFENTVDITQLLLMNPEILERIVEVTKGNLDTYRYLSLKAKFHHMLLIMNDDGELIGSVKAPFHR